MGILSAVNFLLYYMLSILSYYLIIYDSFVHRVELLEFWKLFSQINVKFCSQSKFDKWSYLTMFIVLIVEDTIIFSIGTILSRSNDDYAQFMSFLFFLLMDNRMFFYFLHLKVIEFQLMKIETEFKEIENNECHRKINLSSKIWTRMNTFENGRFKWVQNYYEYVHEMCDHVNSIFGLSNFAIVLLSFQSMLTFLNFMYLEIQMNFSNCSSS